MKTPIVLGLLVFVGSTLAANGQQNRPQGVAQSADTLRVLATAAIRVPLDAVRDEASRAIRRPLAIEYGSARGNLKDSIMAGTAFDVALLLPDVDEQLLKAGKIASAGVVIAKTEVAIGLRGDATPDLSTREKIRDAMLEAKSLRWSDTGAALFTVNKILDTLKIRAAVQSTHNMASAPPPLARGEYEINIYPLSEILANHELRNMGPVIPDLQVPVVVTASISARSRDAAAAGALIAFLQGRAIEPALKTNGFIRDTSAALPGVRLWYTDTGGNGVPVLFIHAAAGNSQVWEHQVPAFTEAGYRVVTYDRRGFGRSVIDPAGPQPGTGADDLFALVNHLGIDRFHLVATAAGGGIAFDFALSFPTRLRSLAVANAVGGVQDQDYLELAERMRPAPQFDALPPDVRELGPSYRASNRGGTERWLDLERTSRPQGQPPAQRTRNRITFGLLEQIKVPTLLITGDADLYLPPAVLRLFANRIKSSESVIVPEAGHSVYWEQPEFFNRSVLEFIRKH